MIKINWFAGFLGLFGTAGILLILSAFSDIDQQPVRHVPAVPKVIAVESFHFSGGAIDFIKRKHAEGYVTKAVTNGGDNATVIVVMEKY